MYPLAHAGITLGVALLFKNALNLRTKTKLVSPFDNCEHSFSPPEARVTSQNLREAVFNLSHTIDYRLILLGSLLPDLIDKPLCFLLFISSRMIGHSLLFFLALTVVAFWLYKSHDKPWLLFLSFGTLVHLILDRMWLKSEALFWPVYGLVFSADESDLSWHQLFTSYTDPAVYIPEIIGGIILLIFIVELIRRKKVYAFITKGNW